MSDLLKLDNEDLKKIGKGAIIAGVGAGSIYFLQAMGNIDFGVWTPVATAIASVLINIIRKYLSKT